MRTGQRCSGVGGSVPGQVGHLRAVRTGQHCHVWDVLGVGGGSTVVVTWVDEIFR